MNKIKIIGISICLCQCHLIFSCERAKESDPIKTQFNQLGMSYVLSPLNYIEEYKTFQMNVHKEKRKLEDQRSNELKKKETGYQKRAKKLYTRIAVLNAMDTASKLIEEYQSKETDETKKEQIKKNLLNLTCYPEVRSVVNKIFSE